MKMMQPLLFAQILTNPKRRESYLNKGAFFTSKKLKVFITHEIHRTNIHLGTGRYASPFVYGERQTP